MSVRKPSLLTVPKRWRSERAIIFGGSSIVIGAALLVIVTAADSYGLAALAGGVLSGGARVVSSAGAADSEAVLFNPAATTPAPTETLHPSSKPTPAGTPTPTSAPSNSGGCTSDDTVAPCIGSATTGASGWGTPIFDDEFNGTSLNTASWSTSWFNGGKVNSNGVSMSPSNVAVSGGDLILTLSSSSSGATIDTDPAQVTGGGGFTMGDGTFTEARIYAPGNGTSLYNWPAFWTDGQSWPTDGEIDILEGLGSATSNYHSPQGASNSGTIAGTWANGWHTYAVDRESGKNSIYWDGKLVRSYATDDGGAPEYLIFSLDCSGGCTTGAASQLKVDYVRVWK